LPAAPAQVTHEGGERVRLVSVRGHGVRREEPV
jgi:hypothetical protein